MTLPVERAPATKVGRTQRTREALISAGRELFAEHPVDAVSIDDIVRAADVAKGSFYNHFPDRETLVRTVVAEIRTDIEAAIAAANDGVEDAARRVARATCVNVRYAVDEPQRARCMVRVSVGSARTNAPLNQGLMADLTAGLATNRFTLANVETGMLFVMAVTQAALARVSLEPSRTNAINLGQQITSLLLRGLGVPAPEAEALAAQASDSIIRGDV